MMRSKWMLLSAGLLTACGCDQTRVDSPPVKVTAEDVRHDAAQAEKTAAEFAKQTKDEYQQQLDTRIKEVDAEIARLQEKARDLKDQDKADGEQKLALLQTKRDAAQAKLAEVRNSTAEAWKDMKQGAQSAWAELDVAFQNAARHF